MSKNFDNNKITNKNDCKKISDTYNKFLKGLVFKLFKTMSIF